MSDQGEKIVWKIGSRSNVDDLGLRTDRLSHYADQFSDQIERGNMPIGVISGAIAMANAMYLGTEEERSSEAITPQMRATRGNAAFFVAWILSLESLGITAGELLVTHHELNYKPEAKSFIDTIEDYLTAGWVPLVNESGSTDDKETKKLVYGGDNDGLGEVVADRTVADRICFLTEEEGLIGKDGQLIEVVDAHNAEEALEAAGEPGELGSGGMRSKVEAALKAASKGRPAHIAHAKYTFELIRNHAVGTFFVPTNLASIVE